MRDKWPAAQDARKQHSAAQRDDTGVAWCVRGVRKLSALPLLLVRDGKKRSEC